jgi:uncharacterized protein YcaQ
MTLSSLGDLRRRAVQTSLRAPDDLPGAIRSLGFVQADPIRAPARAQDLILRQRVAGYRVGDLERRYPKLGIEEDFLYAYGFMPRETMALLHPRSRPIDGFAAELLAFVRSRPVTHPRDLEAAFGKTRAVNNWGGFSKATTQALQDLHYAGALRVAGRQAGIRLYAPASPPPDLALSPAERRERLILLILSILSPISPQSLTSTFALLRRGAPTLPGMAETIAALRKRGAIRATEIDGETYLTLADDPPVEEAPDRVRILAPFDPIVWDRRRFDHLWGWRYRFEAYVPAPKRQLGYYAMPLLWRDQAIGWANGGEEDGSFSLSLRFVGARPTSKAFDRAMDREIARFQKFMRPGGDKLV